MLHLVQTQKNTRNKRHHYSDKQQSAKTAKDNGKMIAREVKSSNRDCGGNCADIKKSKICECIKKLNNQIRQAIKADGQSKPTENQTRQTIKPTENAFARRK